MRPLISVIIPVYNVELYLIQCIESVLNQTYSNLEIILVNDGSTDNSGMICDNYKKKDFRIKVIHKKNGGLSDARNAGIDISTGEFLTCIDSDDVVSENYIELLYHSMNQNDCDIAIGKIEVFYGDEAIHFLEKSKEFEILNPYKSFERILSMFDFDVSACAKLYKSSLFEDIRYPVGRLYEDLATTYKLIGKAKKIVFIHEKIYGYRRNRIGSITNMTAAFSPKKIDIIISMQEFYDYILNFYPSLQPLADCRLCLSAVSVLENLYHANNRNEYYTVEIKMKNLVKTRILCLLKNRQLPPKKKMKIICALLPRRLNMAIHNTYFWLKERER